MIKESKNKKIIIILATIISLLSFQNIVKADSTIKPNETITINLPDSGYCWSLTEGIATASPKSGLFSASETCTITGQSTGKVEIWYKKFGLFQKEKLLTTVTVQEDAMKLIDGDSSDSSNANSSSSSTSSSSNTTIAGQAVTNATKIDPTSTDSAVASYGDTGVTTTASKQSYQMSNGTCQHFNICYYAKVAKNTYYNDGQNELFYKSESDCAGTNTNSYQAFCLDPGAINAISCTKGETKYYADTLINLKSTFGKYMYALYLDYKQNGNCGSGDYSCLATWQSAARLLEFKADDFASYFAYQAVRHPKVQALWQSGSVSGSAVSAANAIVARVMSNASSINTDNAKTASAHIEQDGSIDKSASGFTAHYNVIVENVNGGSVTANISWQDASGNSTGGFNASVGATTMSGTTAIIPVTVTGSVSSSDCSAYTMVANINYANPSDLRNVYVVRALSDAAKQRFLLFESGASNVKTVASTTLNPGNTTCEVETDCKVSDDFVCSDDDVKTVVMNEGTKGSGETDWEACIIGKTDSQGNSYDIQVQNTSDYVATTGTDEETDDIMATLINGEKVKDNTYCTISCKEKYTFNIPGSKKDVKYGTYFSFDIANGAPYHSVVGVSAERQCVTAGQGKSTNDIAYNTYEKIVLDLRKQQVDYLNAYLYYKAVYKELEKEENMTKYITESKQSYHQDDGSHISNWKSGATHDSVWSQFNVGDASWNASYIPKFNVSVKQYKISNPTSVESEIESASYSTTTELSFKTNSSTVKYNVNASKDPYASIYSDYDIFGINSDVAENSKTDNSNTYHWEKTIYVNNLPSGYESGDDTISVKYNLDGRDNKLTKYKETMSRIQSAYKKALEKYNALSRQIRMQSASMLTCTRYLDSVTNTYNFNPKVSFSYDQENYMAMLGSATLTLASNSQPTLATSFHYCKSGSSTAAGVFNCNDDPDKKKFVYGDEIADGADGMAEATAEYYEVGRVGSVATYTCDGGPCYYKSATQFYTYPPDGIVTTKADTTNATIIETDGRVYPVTITTSAGQHEYSLKFEQIGQYFEGTQLGRIMGGNGSKPGTLSAEGRDAEVCYYDVTKPNVNTKCEEIINTSTCKNGDYQGMTQDQVTECVNSLLNKTDDNGIHVCCSEAQSVLNKSNLGSPETVEKYNAACEGLPTCTGFKIASVDTSTTAYDSALVNNSGDLQFTVRSVNLNNLFPNGDNTKGINWTSANTTTNSLQVANDIQSKGESIYGEDPEYQVVMSPTCITAVKEYNANQNDSGGLSDYTGKIDNSQTDTLSGSASYSEEFFSYIKEHDCQVIIKESVGISTIGGNE